MLNLTIWSLFLYLILQSISKVILGFQKECLEFSIHTSYFFRYGSPGYEFPEKGRLLFIDSSFPSPTEGDKMTKGGIVVVKLKNVKDSEEPIHFQ